MKTNVLLILVIATCIATPLLAQTITGNWYGVGTVKKEGEHNSYLSELIIFQNGKKVNGVLNYFFRKMTIESKITGTYDPKTRLFQLNAHPVLNYTASTSEGADCPMEGWFTLRVSQVETSLSGEFTPAQDYKYTCPSINIKFTKSMNADPPLEAGTDMVKKPLAPLPSTLQKTALPKPPDPNAEVIKALNKRAFDLSPVIDVDADSLKITLYDNGEVDNDTVSVFYNRKLLALKQMLSDKPMTFMVPLDTSVNEIAMYAENLGKLPPNTAVAVIYAGEKRYELAMVSTFIKNSTIRFRKKVKPPEAKQ